MGHAADQCMGMLMPFLLVDAGWDASGFVL
jgi:hypothetical protein